MSSPLRLTEEQLEALTRAAEGKDWKAEPWTLQRLVDVRGERVAVVQPATRRRQGWGRSWGEVALLLPDGRWQVIARVTVHRDNPGCYLAKTTRFMYQGRVSRPAYLNDSDLNRLVVDLVRLDDRWASHEANCAELRAEKLTRRFEPLLGRDVAGQLAAAELRAKAEAPPAQETTLRDGPASPAGPGSLREGVTR